MLQAVDAEHAFGAEIGARSSAGAWMSLTVRPADLEPGMTTVWIWLTSVMLNGRCAVRPGPRPSVARQLARDDGALGAGVDDEAIGPAAADADRHRHPLASVLGR